MPCFASEISALSAFSAADSDQDDEDRESGHQGRPCGFRYDHGHNLSAQLPARVVI